MSKERERLKGRRVVINARLTARKAARLRFVFEREGSRLARSFAPLRLMNEAMLSAQIVRSRHRHLSTVLARVPFAVLLYYRGHYCLVVELLTNDKGVGLGARPENEREEEDV